MKILLIIILYFSSSQIYSQEIFFPNNFISASSINKKIESYDYFSNIDLMNYVDTGDLISKSNLNNFASSLNDCSFNPLNGIIIKSSDFNNFFNSINCIFPNSSLLNVSSGAYENISYIKNDTVTWTIDGSLNTGVGFRKLDIYKPISSNQKAIIFFHPLTKTKTLSDSFLISLKNNFINKGYIFISVEFRHPAVEGFSTVEEQFDIAKSISFISKMSSFLNIDKNELNIIGYSKGSLALANILDSRLDNYIDEEFNIKKIYLLDAQITYNKDTYYNLFIDKNQVDYGFLSISAYDAFTTLNDSSKFIAGFQLISDSNAVDSYLSSLNSSHMNSIKDNLPILRMGYNHNEKGLIPVSNVLTSVIPLQINTNEFDYLMHNPRSITVLCNEYNKYGTCSGIDYLNYNGLNIINDIDNFIDN